MSTGSPHGDPTAQQSVRLFLLFLSLVFLAVLPPCVLTNLDPHAHLSLHPAEGTTQALCCPHMVSPTSLAEGASMLPRVYLAGEIAQIQHPSDSLFHLLTHVLVLTHKCALKKGRQWWTRKDHSTQVQVSLLVHPLTDNLLPTALERPHHLLFLSFLLLHPMLFPRAMTHLEIRTVVINQFSFLFPTPVLLLHVTINLEIRISPLRDPTAQRPPAVSVVSASSVTDQSGISAPALRVNSSSARGTATNSPGQSQRVSRQTGRDTLMSVPRERHSTPAPRNSRQSAIRAHAGNLRDTASAIARLLALARPRPSSRPPN